MNAILNQYSYVFISLGALLALLLILRVVRVRWPLIAVTLLAVTAVLTSGWMILHPTLNDVDNSQDAEIMLTNGKPTFVEFFSKYCVGCITARPTIDSLVSTIQDDFNVLRIDIHTDFGRFLREKYQFSYSPEFVLFDTRGEEVWRDHVPPSVIQLSQAAGQTLDLGNS